MGRRHVSYASGLEEDVSLCSQPPWQQVVFVPSRRHHLTAMSPNPLAGIRRGNSKRESGSTGLSLNSKLVQGLILLVACVLFGANLNYASYPPGTVLDIKLGDVTLEQFSYVPTPDGYEFK